MSIGKLLFGLSAATAVISLATPASAAVTAIGNSAARSCYLAAEAQSRPVPAALEICDQALVQEALDHSDHVATLVNRGILQLRVGRVDAAVEDFDQAIALDPRQAEAYLNKGMAVLREGAGWQDAVALFDEALSRQTRRPELAYYGRGIAYEMGGKVAAAYRDYKQASEIAPKWREPKTELARFSVRQP